MAASLQREASEIWKTRSSQSWEWCTPAERIWRPLGSVRSCWWTALLVGHVLKQPWLMVMDAGSLEKTNWAVSLLLVLCYIVSKFKLRPIICSKGCMWSITHIYHRGVFSFSFDSVLQSFQQQASTAAAAATVQLPDEFYFSFYGGIQWYVYSDN